MEATTIRITQNDGYVTHLFCYQTVKNTILGNILLLHGMAEHHERYLTFIHALTEEGFDVYAYDHRGHGTDKPLSELGHIAGKKGATLLVEDARTLCQYIKENGRSDKLAVFGHSMGSLILRCLLQTYDAFTCAIVSSTTMPPVAVSKTGAFLADTICLFRGAKKPSAILHQAMFGGKAYTSLCTRTTFDWLTRDHTIVDKYIDDPYCGFLCTASFYRDLANLSAIASAKTGIAKTRKDFPLLILSGTKDPVGGYGTQIEKLHQLYSSLGFTQAEMKLYPEARHELLNELNADEVYHDILTYLHAKLQ